MDSAKRDALLSKLKGVVRNEIKISCVKSDAPLDVCASRVGGEPGVPADFVWPRYSYTQSRSWLSAFFATKKSKKEEVVSEPLKFVAQINLKDVAALDEDNLLPKSGTLCFFYALEATGFDPKDKGAARVFYFADESELTIANPPDELDEASLTSEYSLTFERRPSLPGVFELSEYVDFNDEDEEVYPDVYEDCCEELGLKKDEWTDDVKLLGYPNIVQNPMEEECEYVTRGFYMGEGRPNLVPEERTKIEEAAKDWILLFQLASFEGEDLDAIFGDCGHIYFWIKKEDLLKRNFDDIWLILQCD